MLSILLYSCSDQIETESTEMQLSDNDPFIKKIYCNNFIPSIILDNYTENKSLKLKSDSGRYDNSGPNDHKYNPPFVTIVGEELYRVNTESKLIPLSTMAKIYLGAIYNGKDIEKDTYTPLAYTTNPFNVSTSAPLDNVILHIDQPGVSSQRSALRDFFAEEPADKQYNPEIFDFRIEQFSSYDELQFVLNSEINTSGFLSSEHTTENESSTNIKKKSGLYIKCVQQNFSVGMDLANGESLVDAQSISEGDNSIFVSDISYGKIILLAIESDNSYEETESAFKKVTNKFLYKKTVTLTEHDIEIINNSTISVFSMAENGSGFKAIKGYQELIDNIANSGEWGNYTAKNPGVPLYSSFSYLKDNSSVNLTYDFKINIPPVYARIEYQNISSPLGSNDVNETKMYQKCDVYLSFYSDPNAFKETRPLSYMKINLRKRELEIDSIYGLSMTWASDFLRDVQSYRNRAKENYSTLTSSTIEEKNWHETKNLIEKDFKPAEIINWGGSDLSAVSGISGLTDYIFDFKIRIYTIEKDLYYKILPPDYNKVDYGNYTDYSSQIPDDSNSNNNSGDGGTERDSRPSRPSDGRPSTRPSYGSNQDSTSTRPSSGRPSTRPVNDSNRDSISTRPSSGRPSTRPVYGSNSDSVSTRPPYNPDGSSD